MSGLPKGWARTNLGELVESQKNGIYKPAETYDDSGIPCLRMYNIENGAIVWKDIKRMLLNPDEIHDYELRPGDVLLNRVNSRELVGKAALIHDGLGPCVFESKNIRLRPNTTVVNAAYLNYALLSQGRDHFSGNAQQVVGMASISQPQVAAFPVVLPPLPEQRRIVAKIKALMARSRAARESLADIPTLLDRYRQSVLASAFRGDLTLGWREVNQRSASDGKALMARLLNARRTKWIGRGRGEDPQLVDSALLPEIPESWAWISAEACCWDITVGHVGPMQHRYVENGIPFLRSLNVRANRFDPSDLKFIPPEFHAELRKSSLSPGDLIIVRTGEPGVACVVPDSLPLANCADLVVARLLPEVRPELLAYYMNSNFAKSLVRDKQVGVAQQHFNVGAMRNMPVPLIPPEEQTEIVEMIRIAFEWSERIEKEITAAVTLNPTLDQSILAKAFRGELVPQDPSDEPAEVLLARIRAEREVQGAPARRRGRPAATPEPVSAPRHAPSPVALDHTAEVVVP